MQVATCWRATLCRATTNTLSLDWVKTSCPSTREVLPHRQGHTHTHAHHTHTHMHIIITQYHVAVSNAVCGVVEVATDTRGEEVPSHAVVWTSP